MTKRSDKCVDPLVTVIKRLAKERRISSYELANSSGVGRNTIMSNFQGRHHPSMDSARRLATALGYKLQLVPMTEQELEQAIAGELEYSPVLEAQA